MTKPEFFLDEVLGSFFTPKKPKRKADPDYGKFRRLCKKHNLIYTVAGDGFVDIEAPDGARFAIGEHWDQRVARLETILETGVDSGSGELSWPAKKRRVEA